MKINKNANLFILSNVINHFGDSLDLIAFIWLSYEVTDSVLLTGIVTAFNGLPSIILGLFSGVLTDHFNKKRLIVIGDTIRGIIVLGIVILYIGNMLNIYILCLSTILISSFEILSTPARRSILPFLVEKEDLRRINSKNATGKKIAQIAGLSLAGIIISKFGLISAVFIDAITFFCSAILIFNIKYKEIDNTVSIQKVSLKAELKEGVSVLKEQSIILKTTIMATVVNLFIGGFNVMILSYCNDVLKNDSQGQSAINTLSIVGLLIINLYLSYTKRSIHVEKIIDIGFFGLGVSLIGFSLCPYKIGAYLIAVLYGIATGCITISSVTILHQNIPLKHIGKVMALISLINESSIPIGNLLVSFVLVQIGVSAAFGIYGILVLLSSVMIITFFKYHAKNSHA